MRGSSVMVCLLSYKANRKNITTRTNVEYLLELPFGDTVPEEYNPLRIEVRFALLLFAVGSVLRYHILENYQHAAISITRSAPPSTSPQGLRSSLDETPGHGSPRRTRRIRSRCLRREK